MKKVYIFGKPTCPICEDAHNKIKYFDMETIEGLTEGSFHEVDDIPTVIIFDNKDELIRRVKRPPVSEDFFRR